MLGKTFEEELSNFETFVNDVQTQLDAILKQPFNLDPTTDVHLDPEVCNARGNTELQQGHYAQAKAWYLRAGTQSVRYLSNLALVCLHLEDYAEALDYADQALQQDPCCWKAYWRKLKALRHLKQPEAWATTLRTFQHQLHQHRTPLSLGSEIQEGCAFFMTHHCVSPAAAWAFPGFLDWLLEQFVQGSFESVVKYVVESPSKVNLEEAIWVQTSFNHVDALGYLANLCQIVMWLSMHLAWTSVPWMLVHALMRQAYPMEVVANFLKSRPTVIPATYLGALQTYLKAHPDLVLVRHVCQASHLRPFLLELLASQPCVTNSSTALLIVLQLNGPASWIHAFLSQPVPPLDSNLTWWGNMALLLSHHLNLTIAEQWGPALLIMLKKWYTHSEHVSACCNIAMTLAKCSKLSDKVRAVIREEGGLDVLHYMAQKVK